MFLGCGVRYLRVVFWCLHSCMVVVSQRHVWENYKNLARTSYMMVMNGHAWFVTGKPPEISSAKLTATFLVFLTGKVQDEGIRLSRMQAHSKPQNEPVSKESFHAKHKELHKLHRLQGSAWTLASILLSVLEDLQYISRLYPNHIPISIAFISIISPVASYGTVMISQLPSIFPSPKPNSWPVDDSQ